MEDVIAVLQAAQDKIIESGWGIGANSDREHSGSVCLEEAIAGTVVWENGYVATNYSPTDKSVKAALAIVKSVIARLYPPFYSRLTPLFSIWPWNDSPDRTESEVLEVLHEAILEVKAQSAV
jgi:hypothetical protein